MEAFITGRSVVSSSGIFTPPTRPPVCASPGGGGGNANGDSKDIVLAERTSQLIDSYRDFVSGGTSRPRPPATPSDDEETLVGRICGSGGDADGGMHSRRDGGGALLRSWSGAQRAGSIDLEMEGILDGEFILDEHRGKKYRNAYGVCRSGKVRRSLLALLAAVVAIACVAGVVRSGRARHNLPDWNQELKEELMEEQETARRGLPHQNAGIELVSAAPEDEREESEDAPAVDERPPEEGTEGTAAAAADATEAAAAAESDATEA